MPDGYLSSNKFNSRTQWKDYWDSPKALNPMYSGKNTSLRQGGRGGTAAGDAAVEN
jgi:hypothetical protein